ncbi:MAG: hypothetical protein GAK37_02476 [Pseudomonas sp.]|nr:MAG: hypothetical protein GAK37_02476 [Pseudomonas sp.]
MSSVDVAADATCVWALVGNFGRFDAFIPALSHIEMTGTGVGALRTKFFHDGHCVVEQLNSHDEQARCMTWSPLYNTLGIAQLWAAMQVAPLAGGGSRVIWTVVAEPLGPDAQGFEQFVRGFTEGALENVRQRYAGPVRS